MVSRGENETEKCQASGSWRGWQNMGSLGAAAALRAQMVPTAAISLGQAQSHEKERVGSCPLARARPQQPHLRAWPKDPSFSLLTGPGVLRVPGLLPGPVSSHPPPGSRRQFSERGLGKWEENWTTSRGWKPTPSPLPLSSCNPKPPPCLPELSLVLCARAGLGEYWGPSGCTS